VLAFLTLRDSTTPMYSGPLAPEAKPFEACEDPTAEARLIELKSRLLEEPRVQAYLREMRTKKLALVLAGGGGKGSYQAGCLLALFDCGIRDFSVFAGTSVGALNAALARELFQTGERKRVVRLWSTISPNKVLHTNPLRLGLALAFRLVMYFCLIPPFLAGHVMVVAERFIGRDFIAVARHSSEFAVFIVLLVTMPLCIVGYFLISGHFLGARHLPFIALTIITAVGLTGLARPWINRHLSLASNEPLRKTIVSSLDIKALRASQVPVYCTVASKVEYWDPFEPGSKPELSESAWRKGYAAGYFKINGRASDAETLTWLMQTAALPEVFPLKPALDGDCVDGGIEDNIPIFPTLLHKPDMLIVLYLDHAFAQNQYLWVDEAARTWWMTEKFYLTLQDRQKAEATRREYILKHGRIVAGAERPKLAPEAPYFSKAQFLPVTPSMPLGGLFGGTMNFSARKARRLMALGYRDTLRVIEGAAKTSAC
jgi:Patatin-like phospholipase